ncbi:M42 family metallopeptidase [uncultured Tateyamaria sp.]|uniref:M42 family metallopeptidase n=1 Tax=uncultured Tateyamaria sp. TaxID=455651 RepID=UPI00263165DD|nr:M42 family metallopeptidase [uncultured Tateyamaria sp.]
MRDLLERLLAVPGLSGHEDRIRRVIAAELEDIGCTHETDRLGNLWTTFRGDGPSVMLFTHMDQLGFVVRKIDADGFLRLSRLGGVPERALASQEVEVSTRHGDLPGIIANKSHHATTPDEKYTVIPVGDLYVDCGFESAAEAEAAGIRIGSPVVYAPGSRALGENRITAPALDDRAGCAVLIEVARALTERAGGPTVHLAFTTQEEFNLRGALPLAERLKPDMAIQIDLMLATDTPDMGDAGEMRLGGGPGISLYSFHGRGTLNGVIPHPAMVRLFEEAADAAGIPLQRSAQTGVLTDLSYVQLVGGGVAAIDVGFPLRYSHASREIVDFRDLDALRDLLVAALCRVGPDFDLSRDGAVA